MKEIIEKLVRQEIRNLLADTKGIIKETVKTLFFSELKAAIRDSISDVLQDIPKECATINETSPIAHLLETGTPTHHEPEARRHGDSSGR